MDLRDSSAPRGPSTLMSLRNWSTAPSSRYLTCRRCVGICHWCHYGHNCSNYLNTLLGWCSTGRPQVHGAVLAAPDDLRVTRCEAGRPSHWVSIMHSTPARNSACHSDLTPDPVCPAWLALTSREYKYTEHPVQDCCLQVDGRRMLCQRQTRCAGTGAADSLFRAGKRCHARAGRAGRRAHVEAVDAQHGIGAVRQARKHAARRQHLRQQEVAALRHHHAALEPAQAAVRHACAQTDRVWVYRVRVSHPTPCSSQTPVCGAATPALRMAAARATRCAQARQASLRGAMRAAGLRSGWRTRSASRPDGCGGSGTARPGRQGRRGDPRGRACHDGQHGRVDADGPQLAAQAAERVQRAAPHKHLRARLAGQRAMHRQRMGRAEPLQAPVADACRRPCCAARSAASPLDKRRSALQDASRCRGSLCPQAAHLPHPRRVTHPSAQVHALRDTARARHCPDRCLTARRVSPTHDRHQFRS